MESIVAGGTANGGFKLLCDLVSSNINADKRSVVFKSSANNLRNTSQAKNCAFCHARGKVLKLRTNLSAVVSQSVGREVNPRHSGVESYKVLVLRQTFGTMQQEPGHAPENSGRFGLQAVAVDVQALQAAVGLQTFKHVTPAFVTNSIEANVEGQKRVIHLKCAADILGSVGVNTIVAQVQRREDNVFS